MNKLVYEDSPRDATGAKPENGVSSVDHSVTEAVIQRGL